MKLNFKIFFLASFSFLTAESSAYCSLASCPQMNNEFQILCSGFGKKPYTIIDATQTLSKAGQPDGNNEWVFKISLKPKKLGITFDSIWIDGHVEKLRVTKPKGSLSAKAFKYTIGDTIQLTGSYFQSKNMNDSTGKVVAPKKFQGRAIFSYNLDGKKYYQSIKEFRKI
ncbi:MAG: hypothetical protein ABIO44_05805 [Saprospiraceae bacterium]